MALGGSHLIRGMALGGSHLIRGGLLYLRIRCCVCISGRVDSLLVFFLYDSLYKAFGKEINNTCKRYLKNLVVRFTNLPLVNTFQHVFFHHHFHIASIWKKRKPSLEYIYILWKIVE
jgi:hypothetical protein